MQINQSVEIYRIDEDSYCTQIWIAKWSGAKEEKSTEFECQKERDSLLQVNIKTSFKHTMINDEIVEF